MEAEKDKLTDDDFVNLGELVEKLHNLADQLTGVSPKRAKKAIRPANSAVGEGLGKGQGGGQQEQEEGGEETTYIVGIFERCTGRLIFLFPALLPHLILPYILPFFSI